MPYTSTAPGSGDMETSLLGPVCPSSGAKNPENPWRSSVGAFQSLSRERWSSRVATDDVLLIVSFFCIRNTQSLNATTPIAKYQNKDQVATLTSTRPLD